MDLTCFKVQYDFKTIKVNFVGKNGKLKQQYICLPYMITFPLTTLLNQGPPPNQPDPFYKRAELTSFKTDDLGYLIYNSVYPPADDKTRIITNHGNILEINNFQYNYDIIVNINNSQEGQIRFMYFNIYNPVASNMNDIYGAETVYDLNGKQQIKFTITGEYQFFFAHYDNNNFDISIKIEVSNKKSPTFVCNKNKRSCTCFEIDGAGFIKINHHHEIKIVPVYVKKALNGLLTTYLYPDFAYLRDIFLNTTLNNSLPAPVPITNTLRKNSFLVQVNPYENLKTVLVCNVDFVLTTAGISEQLLYVISMSGDNILISVPHQPTDYSKDYEIQQLIIIDPTKYRYVYRWNDTPFTAKNNENVSPFFPVQFPFLFSISFYWSLDWHTNPGNTIPTLSTPNTDITQLTFIGGNFTNDNNTQQWVKFPVHTTAPDDRTLYFPNNLIITVTIEPQ